MKPVSKFRVSVYAAGSRVPDSVCKVKEGRRFRFNFKAARKSRAQKLAGALIMQGMTTPGIKVYESISANCESGCVDWVVVNERKFAKAVYAYA